MRTYSETLVTNNAGGTGSFRIDDWTRLRRFLILGSDHTYYVSARALTIRNAAAVLRCIDKYREQVVDEIVAVSEGGYAPKNDPALFALALCAASKDRAVSERAFEVLPRVARTGTHLFRFISEMQNLRGWGRMARRGVANWYNGKPADRLAYLLVKYRQRGGWSHRDVLRLCHAVPSDDAHNAMYRWVVSGETSDKLPSLILDFLSLQNANDADAIALLRANPSLTWEMLPNHLLGNPEIWRTLQEHMPMMAMLRNLARMTANGSINVDLVVERLADLNAIKRARLHPIAILTALLTYSSGQGLMGKLTWEPHRKVIDALDNAFYLAFETVEPTNKRLCLALDVSASMEYGNIIGAPQLTPRAGSAAMALVTANVESNVEFIAFSHDMLPIDIRAGMSLEDVIHILDNMPFGGTNCSLPMWWAQENDKLFDAFIIYTDNETWLDDDNPPAARLRTYRSTMVPGARLVTVGMTSSGFSIADPDDPGMLDVVGFDTTTPNLISQFIGGAI